MDITHALSLMTDEDRAFLDKAGLKLPFYYDTIKTYLPHRYPFMMIDKVVALKPSDFICGIKNVSINEPIFNGHFPDNPIMPGVMMVEAMAQLAGILGFVSAGESAQSGYLYLFAGVDKVRFKKLVRPGDQLVFSARYLMDKQGIYKFDCKAHVDGKLAVAAQIMIARQAQSADQ